MAARVLGKSWRAALVEMKASPPELRPQHGEPLAVVGVYDSYSTATFAMS